MKILLIGGAGFIGTHLIKTLCPEHDVTVVDVHPVQKDAVRWLLKNNWTYTQEPFRGLVGSTDFDVIVPLVGLLGSVPNTQEPLVSLQTHAENNLHLLTVLAEIGKTPLIIYPSSQLALRPRCIYSHHKILVEGYLRVFQSVHGIPYISLRMATGYGPFQQRDSVINFYIKRALAGETLPVYGKGDDRRGFIYIEDAAEAFGWAIEGRFPKNRTYGLGGHNLTLTQVAEAIAKQVGGSVEHVPWPELARTVDVGDLPVGNDLVPWGWEPKYGFTEGVERTARWLHDELA